MNREDIIENVIKGWEPLGPEGLYDERERQWQEWLAALPPQAVSSIIDVLIDPPSEASSPWFQETWDHALGFCIAECAKKDTDLVLRAVRPFLDATRGRPGLVWAICLIESDKTLPLFRYLIQSKSFTPGEAMEIRDRLLDIGDKEATSLLDLMDAKKG